MSPLNVKNLFMLLCIGAASVVAGCSSPNSQVFFDPNSGKHVAGWVSTHPAQFLSDQSQCTPCHGADLHGGMSGVSCYSASFGGMSCHANGPGHADPAAWADPAQHGAAAKAAPNPAAMHGFSTCQICHGVDFTGGMSLTACASCHGGSAPHPTSWLPTDTYRHDTTNEGNAPVCFICHANGKNSPIGPPPAPPAGTPPGCFNNTLCHAAVGHPAGWSDPSKHGAAAKSTPAAAAGFAYCESCHGSDFTGGAALTSCFSCHGVSAPHAPAPWRMPTSAYTHTSTDQGNAPVCAQCHTNGANSSVQPNPPAPAGTPPGCFNNTLCHATLVCGSCHGIPPDGTAFPNSAGSHTQHMAVNTNIVCGTCHQGAGSGTALHQNGVVDVILDPTYNAKSGTAAYASASLTCTNIACHGSSRTQTSTQANANPPQSTPGRTPVWGSGTIDVNTQCTACHVLGQSAGLPENNSYYSGQHRRHVYRQGRACTDCHDTTKLAPVHFTSLTAPISETTAAATLKSTLNFNGTTCNPGCHGTETW